MKLFDLFKNRSKKTNSIPKSDANQEKRCREIKYETKFSAKDITSNREIINRIVDKMVKEDPFKNFYTGKVDADFTPLSKRVYKYDAITTINVDLLPQDETFTVSIEGISIGTLPDPLSNKLSEYYHDSLLTAYAYVTGGLYKEYDRTKETVVEKEEPCGVDIYIQFT